MPGPIADHVERRARERLGQLLSGKYRLTELLGIGGMGAVYAGAHRNGLRVAVKVLHAEVAASPDLAARFLREGYVANRIDHPGIVRALDDDTAEDGAPYLVMELFDGETLEARAHREDAPLSPGEIAAIGVALLDVLAAAHAAGVVHRDVKPENVLLTTDGRLKVLDFGIARVADATGGGLATEYGSSLGTPLYMAPEQALGRVEDIDGRTDVFGVGATLFRLLAGRHVHGEGRSPEILVRAATRRAEPLGEVAAGVPPRLAAAVDRALAFDREGRFPDARAMAEALEGALGEPLPPVPSGAARPPPVDLEAPTVVANVDPLAATAFVDSGNRSAALAGSARARAAATTKPSPATPEATTPRSRPRARTVPGALALAVVAIGAVAALIATLARPPRAPTAPVAPSTPDASAPRCAGHRACAEALGVPAVCGPSGACAALETTGCRTLAEPGDLGADETIWLGAMFPLTGRAATTYGEASVRAVDLARRDFVGALGGLPPLGAGTRRRPVAIVACDDSEDARRAAEHLVERIGVPAVLGFGRSRDVVELTPSYFLPHSVLALAANTASALADLPRFPGGARVVERITTTSRAFAEANARFVGEVLNPLVERRPATRGRAPRLAIVRPENPSGVSHSAELAARLRWNGRPVIDAGEDVLWLVASESLGGPTPPEETQRIAAAIVEHGSDVVLWDGGLFDAMTTAIEQRWRADRARPIYVVDQIWPETTRAVLRARPDLRARLFAVNTATTPALQRFVARYDEVYTPRITADEAVSAPFDAFYVAAYAIVASGRARPTGAELAGALGRLRTGETVEVGAGAISATVAALGAGKSVDLEGTATTLDVDPATGDPRVRMTAYCLGPGAGVEPRDIVDAGVALGAGDGPVTGALRCGDTAHPRR
jgi:serine/threonine-protein kinase